MSNRNQVAINELRARIRGLQASMADMGYSMRLEVKAEINRAKEILALLETG